MFAGGLDEERHELHDVAAGCPGLLYRGAPDATEQLAATHPPLAVGRSFSTAAPARTDLDPGDALALITDGFYEWSASARDPHDQPEPFGLERIAQVMRDERDRTATGRIEALRAAAAAFAGAPVTDDLTAVVVKRV